MNKATITNPKIQAITNTTAELSEQNITYNQAGISYNESGYMYGGADRNSSPGPINLKANVI